MRLQLQPKATGVLAVFLVLMLACAPAPAPSAVPVSTHETQLSLKRDSDVPHLPFADNPDPTQCGIPVQWGLDDPAFLSGYYEGELIQQEVLLYESHLRLSITGAAPTDSAVRVILFQENPGLDYYMVETLDMDPNQTGWEPSPFLQFEAQE